MNGKKIKFMIMERIEENGENILQINTVAGKKFEFEKVDEFVYLKVLIEMNRKEE